MSSLLRVTEFQRNVGVGLHGAAAERSCAFVSFFVSLWDFPASAVKLSLFDAVVFAPPCEPACLRLSLRND